MEKAGLEEGIVAGEGTKTKSDGVGVGGSDGGSGGRGEAVT